MTTLDHIIVAVFGVVYPAYSFFSYRKSKPKLIAGKPGQRLRDYIETIVCLWLLALLAISAWVYQDRAIMDLGFGYEVNWAVWVGLSLALIQIIATVGQFILAQRHEKKLQSLRTSFKRVDATELFPRTEKELSWFIALSISAGVCEEILFRGFLIWYFQSFGIVIAVILSSVMFGAAHMYQGFKGAIKTAVVGLVLAVSYVLTNSLWIPILLHISIDVPAGMLGWLVFREPEKLPNTA